MPAAAVVSAARILHRHGGWLWMVPLLFVVTQLVLSWSQRPCKTTCEQEAALALLRVTVNIPCYNEDPPILDRTIWALMRQSRPPQRVEVVDDGSTVDYTAVRDWWQAHSGPVEFSWVRQDNAGKKHAQAVTFTTDLAADVFVTIDSDSALDRHALAEGLKPFARPEVVSVAGLETAFNMTKNFLTRMQGMRVLVFQLFAMSAQSEAGGATLINPGAFSLYRGWLIRKVAHAYVNEKFFGTPVTLGDDTLLTLYALCHGKAVHQPSAVAMNVYPETLSHHTRQWTRWMRASTIRTFWRLRYLPLSNYSFWFSIYQMWAYMASLSFTVYAIAAWPASQRLVIAAVIALAVWPLAIASRLITISRSDMTIFDTLAGVALLPVAAAWYTLVLRQIRLYGAATCARQKWGTREKVEVTA